MDVATLRAKAIWRLWMQLNQIKAGEWYYLHIGKSKKIVRAELRQRTTRRPRVLLADNHRLVREALAKLLERSCDVVGTVANFRALLAAARELRPDIVVLDVAMPLHGLAAARQLRRVMPHIKVIFLTVSEDRDLFAEAFRAGASALLLKTSATSELIQAIQEVFVGRSFVTPFATKGLVNSFRRESKRPKRNGISSPRKREVLQLLVEGRTMKEIGRMLRVTARTVAFHKYTMMKQLGIKSSAELIQFAIKHLAPPLT
jgi:DNA-binding NarL/FixJ family response regulator